MVVFNRMTIFELYLLHVHIILPGAVFGRDRMVVGFTTTNVPVQSVPITTKVVSSNPVHGDCLLDTTLCDKICQWLATGRWFCPGTSVSSTNKTDRNDITEILLKVTINIINPHYLTRNGVKGDNFSCDTDITLPYKMTGKYPGRHQLLLRVYILQHGVRADHHVYLLCMAYLPFWK